MSQSATLTNEIKLAPSLFDPAVVNQTLTTLFDPGTVFEIRAVDASLDGKLWKKGIVSGYFNDPAAVTAALSTVATAQSIYITMNPCDPALLARRVNRLDMAGKDGTTNDKQIPARRWLLIDIDPTRPAGISSSESEKQAAEDTAMAIKQFLAGRGWTEPVVADSGNGWHLLYRLDLPADDGGIVAAILKALASRFDNQSCKVDQTVFNAARIVKLHGTRACKGDSTAERPHRMSRFTSQPTTLGIVTSDQLNSLVADLTPPKPVAPAAVPHNGSHFDVREFLTRHCTVTKESTHDGSERFTLDACPWFPEHKDAAVFVGSDGRLGFKCFHNSCSGRGWKQFREHFDPTCYTKTTTTTRPEPEVIEDEPETLEPTYIAPAFDQVMEGIKGSCLEVYVTEVMKTGELPIGFCLADAILFGCLLMSKLNWRIGVANDPTPRRCNAFVAHIGSSGTGKGMAADILRHLADKAEVFELTGRSGAFIANTCNGNDKEKPPEHARRGLYYMDEIKPILSVRDHVGTGLVETFLSGYDKGYLEHSTASGGRVKPVYVKGFSPSLLLLGQPELIESAVGTTNCDAGFWARFLVVMNPSKRKSKKLCGVDSDRIIGEFQSRIKILNNSIVRPPIPESQVDKLDLPSGAMASWSRLSGDYLPRIACLLDPDGAERGTISGEAMQRARVVVEWFLGQSMQLLGMVHGDRFAMLVSRFERHIHQSPGCTDRTLYRTLRIDHRTFDTVAMTAINRGYVICERETFGHHRRIWQPKTVTVTDTLTVDTYSQAGIAKNDLSTIHTSTKTDVNDCVKIYPLVTVPKSPSTLLVSVNHAEPVPPDSSADTWESIAAW